jgi:integrase
VRDTAAPKNNAAEHRVPTAPELTKIIQAAVGTRFEIAILLSATAGARRGQVLGLRWNNVDLDAGRITIAEALARVDRQMVWVEPKTSRSNRPASVRAHGCPLGVP